MHANKALRSCTLRVNKALRPRPLRVDKPLGPRTLRVNKAYQLKMTKCAFILVSYPSR